MERLHTSEQPVALFEALDIKEVFSEVHAVLLMPIASRRITEGESSSLLFTPAHQVLTAVDEIP